MKAHLDSNTLEEIFRNCEDVKELKYTFERNLNMTMFYCKGLCNEEFLMDEFIPTLQQHIKEKLHKSNILKEFNKVPHQEINTEQEAIEKVFLGELLVFIHDESKLYAFEMGKPPNRQPEETSAEVTIRGPRDGFVESIEINVALIRKRMKTTSLSYEKFIVGKRSRTQVGLLYFHDIAQPETINHIRYLIKKINVDALVNNNQLEELIDESPFRVLPMMHYSGRPDFAINSLLYGRFLIFIDGSPIALIGPVNLPFLLKTGEDYEYPWFFNSVERLLRVGGLIIGILLPGFWVALAAFHPDQIPLVFLSTAAQARQGIPLPTPIEALILVLLFDLLKEAGLRLPFSVGQILGVVGGLIIGDAAIRAGITSPANVMIIATSTVATFTISNQSLSGIVTLTRIFVLIISSIMGLFGFFVASFFVLIHIANLRSFNLPYLAPIAPFNLKDFLASIFHLPEKLKKERLKMLNVQDSDKGGN